jgi:hypothetical protein
MKAIILILDDEQMCASAVRLLLNQVLTERGIEHKLIICNDKQETQKAQAMLDNIPFLFGFDPAPLIEKLTLHDSIIEDIKVFSDKKYTLKMYQTGKKDQYFKRGKNFKVVKGIRTTKK